MRSRHNANFELAGFMMGALGGLVGSIAFIATLHALRSLFPVDPGAIIPDFRPPLLALAITTIVIGPLAALGTSAGLARVAGERERVRPKSFILLCLGWVVALPGSILLGAMWAAQITALWRFVLVASVLCGLMMAGAANIKRHA